MREQKAFFFFNVAPGIKYRVCNAEITVKSYELL